MSGQYDQIQSLVLQTLDKSQDGTIPDSRQLGLSTPEAQTTLKAVLDSLLSKEMIGYKQITTTSFVLSQEGNQIVKEGSHEYRVWEVLPAPGGGAMPMADLKVSVLICCLVERKEWDDRVELIK
jgi:phenylalanyl-tRNA synthetase alpha chain